MQSARVVAACDAAGSREVSDQHAVAQAKSRAEETHADHGRTKTVFQVQAVLDEQRSQDATGGAHHGAHARGASFARGIDHHADAKSSQRSVEAAESGGRSCLWRGMDRVGKGRGGDRSGAHTKEQSALGVALPTRPGRIAKGGGKRTDQAAQAGTEGQRHRIARGQRSVVCDQGASAEPDQ